MSWWMVRVVRHRIWLWRMELGVVWRRMGMTLDSRWLEARERQQVAVGGAEGLEEGLAR
jgi:hypothetical protein